MVFVFTRPAIEVDWLINSMPTFYTTFPSPLGTIVISTDGHILTGFRFLDQKHFASIPTDWKKSSSQPLLVQVEQQAREYFAGKRKNFSVPFGCEGTVFQKNVWRVLQNVRYGTTSTYSEIAAKIGQPRAVRAVATAIGHNPICIVLPCHGILAKNGELAGYAGGLERKAKLLKLESANM